MNLTGDERYWVVSKRFGEALAKLNKLKEILPKIQKDPSKYDEFKREVVWFNIKMREFVEAKAESPEFAEPFRKVKSIRLVVEENQ